MLIDGALAAWVLWIIGVGIVLRVLIINWFDGGCANPAPPAVADCPTPQECPYLWAPDGDGARWEATITLQLKMGEGSGLCPLRLTLNGEHYMALLAWYGWDSELGRWHHPPQRGDYGNLGYRQRFALIRNNWFLGDYGGHGRLLPIVMSDSVEMPEVEWEERKHA